MFARGCMPWALFCCFCLGLYGLWRVRSVAQWHGIPSSCRLCCTSSSWFWVFAYDCVDRAHHFDLCRWQPAHAHYTFNIFLWSAMKGFGVTQSIFRLAFLDISTSLARSMPSALLSPCMSSVAMFHGTIARAKLCLHFTFRWRRRCMLRIEFRAGKLNGN